MTTRQLLSLAFRESRFARRRLFLFLSAISLGVAALVAVQGFASTMKREMSAQARAMLGADVQLQSRDPFGPRTTEVLESLARGGIDVARVTSFASMARHAENGATRLVQVRAADVDEVRAAFGDIPCIELGTLRADGRVRVRAGDTVLLDAGRAELQQTWAATSHRMQRLRDEPQSADEEYAAIAADDD
ncbi:MAG: ABC transporter permease, partial [Gammaproteobacteria bacterium]